MPKDPWYGTGKKADYLIEENWSMDHTTGQEAFICYLVWADVGLGDALAGLEGVWAVKSNAVQYFVFPDPRYDREWVRSEIEAFLVLHKDKKEMQAIKQKALQIVNDASETTNKAD